MEVLVQAQSILMEHAFTIGIGLLVAVLIAGIAWYSMSRPSVKSQVLENQARVNEANMEPSQMMQGQGQNQNQDEVEQSHEAAPQEPEMDE